MNMLVNIAACFDLKEIKDDVYILLKSHTIYNNGSINRKLLESI